MKKWKVATIKTPQEPLELHYLEVRFGSVWSVRNISVRFGQRRREIAPRSGTVRPACQQLLLPMANAYVSLVTKQHPSQSRIHLVRCTGYEKQIYEKRKTTKIYEKCAKSSVGNPCTHQKVPRLNKEAASSQSYRELPIDAVRLLSCAKDMQGLGPLPKLIKVYICSIIFLSGLCKLTPKVSVKTTWYNQHR